MRAGIYQLFCGGFLAAGELLCPNCFYILLQKWDSHSSFFSWSDVCDILVLYVAALRLLSVWCRDGSGHAEKQLSVEVLVSAEEYFSFLVLEVSWLDGTW